MSARSESAIANRESGASNSGGSNSSMLTVSVCAGHKLNDSSAVNIANMDAMCLFLQIKFPKYLYQLRLILEWNVYTPFTLG